VTDFGKEIAIAAEKFWMKSKQLTIKPWLTKGNFTGVWKFPVSTGKYVMPYFLRFFKTEPRVDLILDVTNKKQVLESLENNEVDFS
jgi:hypothetical protein